MQRSAFLTATFDGGGGRVVVEAGQAEAAEQLVARRRSGDGTCKRLRPGGTRAKFF